jgi:hypothetical protein
MAGSRSGASCLCAGAAILALVAGCNGPDALEAWPATLVIRSAGSQVALIGSTVNDPPAVQLLDSDGKPIADAKITFRVTGGGGSVTGGVATTGRDGVARVGAWAVTPGLNGVTASIPAPFRVPPLGFAATGVAAAFRIDLLYLTSVTAGRQAVFDSAAARWARIIYGDVPDLVFTMPAGQCGPNAPAFNQTVDDVIILVTLDSIDGPGQILGQAGPCWLRDPGFLPILGLMRFDTADVATLEGLGYFDEVILHEMGHVLGFGTIWRSQFLNLLSGAGGTDPFFTGGNGRATFDRIGGTTYTGGQKVPVENSGGSGTRDSHWRESVLDNELMTGFLDAGGAVNPLSVVTIASLSDEGYLTNYAAADIYALPFSVALRAPATPVGPAIALGDDILRLPIYLVDRQGRVTGVLRR